MAQGRMLQRKISRNRDLPRLVALLDERMGEPHGALAALLYTWCIAHLDVAGRMHGDPDVVKGEVVPRISAITPELVRTYSEAMAEVGLVHYYEADGDRWLEFRGFKDSQPGLRPEKEAASRVPSPSAGTPISSLSSGPTPELVRSNSRPTPLEVKEKRREVEEKIPGTASPAEGDQQPLELVEPPKPRRAKKPTPHGLQDALEHFQRRWIAVKQPVDGLPPKLEAADVQAVIGLLRSHPLDAVLSWIGRYLDDDDPWLGKNGHALRHLPRRVDGYRSSPPRRASSGAKGWSAPSTAPAETRDATDEL
jgi:hypothetical protein